MLAPPFAVPLTPGEETAEEGPPIEMAGELESSIIMTACRRFDPALITMGVSEKGGSERKVFGGVGW